MDTITICKALIELFKEDGLFVSDFYEIITPAQFTIWTSTFTFTVMVQDGEIQVFDAGIRTYRVEPSRIKKFDLADPDLGHSIAAYVKQYTPPETPHSEFVERNISKRLDEAQKYNAKPAG